MRILSLLILCALLFFFNRQADSPHGSDFKISCKTCHSSKGWQLDKEIYSFDHNSTRLPLTGQHSMITCRQCHPTLVFAEAKTQCNECHNDVHQATVSPECSLCHTPASWLVNNINEIHQMSRFPLLGAHRTADCYQCHKSESLLRFDVIGVNCIDCHRQNYMATTNPNHVQSGISEDCSPCHPINSFQWVGAGFNHSIFPLVQGHSTVKCTDCHIAGNYASTPTDCYSCHQQNYTSTTNPNHVAAGFSTTCGTCHTLNPGWKPATFNHTGFPLTLGHSTPVCTDCHIGGNYTTTPTDCYSCHQQNYTSTTNPNHVSGGFPTACGTCHTLNPGWKPSTFNHTTFPLTLGHSTPACSDCHIGGNYTTTPTDCYSCHQTNYNNTTNPNHGTLGFSTTCTQCHTTNPGWKPATYLQHDSQFFPIYSGRHNGQWTFCSDCHTNAGNYTLFNCIICHANAHSGKNYTNAQCYSCHPKGTSDKK
jgi:hypothetical protein